MTIAPQHDMQRAFDIMATNPTLTADEACDMGLIARVVDDEAFDDTAEAIIEQLLANPSNSAGLENGRLRRNIDCLGSGEW